MASMVAGAYPIKVGLAPFTQTKTGIFPQGKKYNAGLTSLHCLPRQTRMAGHDSCISTISLKTLPPFLLSRRG